jgi:hypothetical protein
MYHAHVPNGAEGVASTLAVVKGNRNNRQDDEDDSVEAMLMLRTGPQHRAGRLSMLHMACNHDIVVHRDVHTIAAKHQHSIQVHGCLQRGSHPMRNGKFWLATRRHTCGTRVWWWQGKLLNY